VLRHTNAVERRERLRAPEACEHLGGSGHRISECTRESQAWSRPAHQSCNVGQHVGEQNVLPPENVPLANSSALQGGSVSARYVVDVDVIQSGIDESGNSAARGLDNDSARRGRPNVPWTDRCRGVDDHGRQSLTGNHAVDQPLGCNFALLVGADTLAFAEGSALVGRRAVGTQRKGCHAAGVNYALDAGTQCFFHDRACSVHVGEHDLIGIARPQPIIGGDMEDITHAGHGPADGDRVAQVPLAELDPQCGKVIAAAARPDQGANREVPALEGPGDCRAHEPAGASDEDRGASVHRLSASDLHRPGGAGSASAPAGSCGPATVWMRHCSNDVID
jgi:hypothetical protein